MYDGTITEPDPYLVTTFALDDQTTAYVVQDTDADAPNWDGIGYVYAVSNDHERYDSLVIAGDAQDSSPLPVSVTRDAWDRFRDWDVVARYLRMFHDAVSVDYSSSLDRGATIVAVVTRTQADAWGCSDRDELAGDALDVYRQYVEGNVYGVIVVNTVTGDEDSLWNVYDSSPNLDYCHTVAQDIAPIGVA